MNAWNRSSATGRVIFVVVAAAVVCGLSALVAAVLTGGVSPWAAVDAAGAQAPPVSTATPPSATTTGWRGEYFVDRLVGYPLLVRVDPGINFDWGMGSPAPEIPVDNFSVRWTTNLDLAAGIYRFSVSVDDGVRLWVDNRLVINGWQNGPSRDFVTHVNLAQGPHVAIMEYYDATGAALVQLDVSLVQASPEQPNLGDLPPLAVISGPAQAQVGQPVSFSATGSTVAGGSQIVSFDWTWGDGTGASGADVTHLYNNPGVYEVTLTVADDKGRSNRAMHQIQVVQAPAGPGPGQPPIAVIQAGAEAYVGQSTLFDASGSQSANPIVSYAWQFGDGATGEGMTITHAYMAPGSFTVTLTVADDRGLSSTAQHVIRVDASASHPIATPPPVATPPIEEGPPVPVISAPSEGIAGQPIRFDASSSQSAYPITSYVWEFGDGATAEGIAVDKVYDAPGNYNVRLILTDNRGQQASADVGIRIVPQAALPTLEPDLVPVISAPPEGIVGQPIRFDASGSHSANPIASYAWEFGDGTTAEGMAVDKVYGALGNYNVRLTLTDNQGLQASVDVGIRIMPQAALPTLEPEPVPTLLPEVTSIPEAIPTSAP